MKYVIISVFLVFVPVIGADKASFQPVTFSGHDPSRPASEPLALAVMTLKSASEGSPSFCIYDYYYPQPRAIRVESAPELGTKLLPRIMPKKYYTSRACRAMLGHCLKPKVLKPEFMMHRPSPMPGVLNMTASVFTRVRKVLFDDNMAMRELKNKEPYKGDDSCYGWYQGDSDSEYSYEYDSDDGGWADSLAAGDGHVVVCDEYHVRSVFRQIEDGEYNLDNLHYEIGDWPAEFSGLGQSLVNEAYHVGYFDEVFLRDLKEEYFGDGYY